MQSASQTAAFYREVLEHGFVWTIRDEGGFTAPLGAGGERAQPFWSSRVRVERVSAAVAAYRGLTLVEITPDVLLGRQGSRAWQKWHSCGNQLDRGPDNRL
ncbi:DUF2750 domain-containing protein [Xanthomonas massiliensis]|uniref:DUF2750 domain-containing protein n=1 Tax=Xanthomonas massiliensis TaxID=1720302 RepID=UPI00191A8814